MLYGFYPSIYLQGIKINEMSDAANLTLGPTAVWGMMSHTKSMQLNQLVGDFSYSPTGYGVVWDPDVWDHQINSIRPI